MRQKNIKNKQASVRARLLNLAKEKGIDFNRMLLLYFQQAFLARLAQSPFARQLVLKGGLLFYGISGLDARPTRDMDFLGRQIPNELPQIKKVITH